MGPEMIWLIAIGGFAAFIANVLYMIGGTDLGGGGKKWVRRFVASFILALSATIIALIVSGFDWRYLLFYPILAIGFSLPYGGDSTVVKAIKRTIFALGVVSCCIVGAWIHGFSALSLLVCGLSVVTGITSVALGIWNPFNNAPLEQFLICQVLTLYVPWWVFVK